MSKRRKQSTPVQDEMVESTQSETHTQRWIIELPQEDSESSSSSSSSRISRKPRKIPDEECAKLIAQSINKILKQSLDEDFRQECFQMLNVTNSDDAEIIIRNKLRSTIGLLPEEMELSRLVERMESARLTEFLCSQSQTLADFALMSQSQSILQDLPDSNSPILTSFIEENFNSQLSSIPSYDSQLILTQDSQEIEGSQEMTQETEESESQSLLANIHIDDALTNTQESSGSSYNSQQLLSSQDDSSSENSQIHLEQSPTRRKSGLLTHLKTKLGKKKQRSTQ